MELKEKQKNLLGSNLVLSKKTKGSLFKEKPIFYNDGKFLIASCEESCHMYSTSTGNHVKELFHCSANIVSFQEHPLNSTLIIATTEIGEIIVFNIKKNRVEDTKKLVISETILKDISEDKSLTNFTDVKFLYAETRVSTNDTGNMLIWASWHVKDEVQAHISVFSFENGELVNPSSFKKIHLRMSYLNFVVSTNHEINFFVGISEAYAHVIRFNKNNFSIISYKKHYVGQNITLKCVALHPVENCYATGDSIGRIIIWRNIFEKYPLKDIFHWHALPVQSIMFSAVGNYLFSGGSENVLVKWSLVSRKKQYLPRLSSSICHLSQAFESSLISVTTLDGKVLILNYNFENISTIQLFSKWSTLKGESDLSIFTVDPKSDCLVLNGKTGHIQFLSIRDEGKFLYTLDVTNRNFVTSDRICLIPNTEVTHAIFNKTGKWLITSEARKKGLCKEFRLKFWKFIDSKDSFTLNTNVEYPHSDADVHSIAISLDDVVATTGADKKFRLWTFVQNQKANKLTENWSIFGGGEYRHLSCFPIDFSKDSSLVAVGFESILTIWDTNNYVLQCSLSQLNKKYVLKACKFGNNEFSHLIVTGSDYNICVWNTITLSVIWTVPFQLSTLISDEFNNFMLAFSKDNTLVVFNPISPSPILLKENICGQPIISACSSRNRQGNFCIYLLTSNQDLFCLEDMDKPEEHIKQSEENTENVPFTPFSAQLPEIKSATDFNKSNNVSLIKNNQVLVTSILDSQSYTLPNPSVLCLDILKKFLLFSLNKPVNYPSTKEKKRCSFSNPNKLAFRNEQEASAIKNEDSEKSLLKLVNAMFV